MSETLKENIPQYTLDKAEYEEAEGAKAEEPIEAEEVKEIKVKKNPRKVATFLEDEEEKLKEFFQNTTEEIKQLPEKKTNSKLF